MEEEDDVWDKFTPTSELVSSSLGVMRKRYEMPYEVESEEKEEESEATEFYLKLEELERREREEEEDSNNEYETRLVKFENSCNKLLGEIEGSLSCLNRIGEGHETMTQKASALHKRCQKLLREQNQLQNVLDKIEEPLSYYDELERLAPLFGVPDAIPEVARRRVESRESKITRLQDLELEDDEDEDASHRILAPGSQSFSLELERVEECIRFMEHHPRYRGTTEYLAKFRLVRSNALRLARIKVETSLRDVTTGIMNDLERKKKKNIDLADTTMLYVKIRGLGRSLRPIIVDVERRVDQKEFATLLMDFHRCFCEHRLKLLLPIAKEHLSSISRESEDNIGRVARDSFEFLQTICEDEQDLFHEFFTPSAIHHGAGLVDSEKVSNLMGEMMRDLCDSLYTELRPRILQQVDIDILCDLVQIFGELQARASAVSSSSNHQEDEKRKYRTLSNISEGGDSVPVFCGLIQRMIADIQEKLVYRFEKHLDKKIRSFRPSKSDLEYPNILFKNTEHTVRYPTLKETLSSLTKMYSSTNRKVFQILAKSSLTACIQSLREASNSITVSSSVLDGTLFLISQLLILTEQIARFDVDLIITEKKTSAGKLLGGLVNTIVKGGLSSDIPTSSSSESFLGRLFSIRDNPFLGAVRANITVETIDSKQKLADELSSAIRNFIEHSMLYVAKSLVLITVELEKEKISLSHDENTFNSDISSSSSKKKKMKALKDSTFLFKAVMNEDLETLRDAMRDYGKEVVLNIRNKADQTLVELATLRHKQKSIQVLTEKPNTNALFKAVMQEDVDMLEVAIVKYDRQVLRSLRNKAGETLCELAKSRNKTRAWSVLKSLEKKNLSKGKVHDDARRKKHVNELASTCEGIRDRVQSLRDKIQVYSRKDIETVASLFDPIQKKLLESCDLLEKNLTEKTGYVKDEVISIRQSLAFIRDAMDGKSRENSSGMSL